MANYPELRGRNVLVTGGANGIGASIVAAFVQQRARVFFCDVDVIAGRRLTAEFDVGVEFQRVDLVREHHIVRWIAGIIKRHRTIDVLVNNAAADPRIALAKVTRQAWDDLFARNLRAAFLTAREAAPAMPGGAAIINLASITFHIAPAEMTTYVATKGGMIALTRSLARELGPRRIRVNTVSPGWIMTERQLRQFVTPAVKKLIKRSQCVPDLLMPQDIAEVALFLASNASRALTGQELLADRGWAHS